MSRFEFQLSGHEQSLAPTAGKSATCKSCGHCSWMGVNGLRKLADALERGANEVFLDRDIVERARIPMERLLRFAAAKGRVVPGANDPESL